MRTHARLFFIAALFNWFAVPFVYFFGETLLQMRQVSGTGLFWRDLVLMFVIAFGIAYAMVAIDPQRYRPLIVAGILGKLGFVTVTAGHWLAGNVTSAFFLLVLPDLVFSILFIGFLKRHPDSTAAGTVG